MGVGRFTKVGVWLGLAVGEEVGLEVEIKIGAGLPSSPVGLEPLEYLPEQALNQVTNRTRIISLRMIELYPHHLPLAEGCAKLAACPKIPC